LFSLTVKAARAADKPLEDLFQVFGRQRWQAANY
jgi:hypothetical protein